MHWASEVKTCLPCALSLICSCFLASHSGVRGSLTVSNFSIEIGFILAQKPLNSRQSASWPWPASA